MRNYVTAGAAVALLVLAACGAEEAAKKIAGCKGACENMTTDCKTQLSVVASLDDVGGPFSSSDSCMNKCYVTEVTETWDNILECAVADEVADAGAGAAMCEAFKLCVYRDIPDASILKDKACPKTCQSVGECSQKFQVILPEGYSFTDQETCEQDCATGDFTVTGDNWGKAAECTVAEKIPTNASDCQKFQSCALLTANPGQ